MSREISRHEMKKICEEIYQGDLLQAICRYKEASGKGLKESRAFIAQLAERLHEETPEKFRRPNTVGCLTFLAVAVPPLAWLLVGLA